MIEDFEKLLDDLSAKYDISTTRAAQILMGKGIRSTGDASFKDIDVIVQETLRSQEERWPGSDPRKNLPNPGPIPFADIPDWIINLNLTMRTSRIIHRGEIHSFSELCSLSDDVLMRIPHMGQKSLKEIRVVCEVERHKWPTWMTEMAAPDGPEETRRQGCSLNRQLEKVIGEEYAGASRYYEISEKLDQIGADQEGRIIKKLKDDELLHFFVLKGIVEHLDERYGCHR